MKKKTIRTIIISVLVFLTAVITIFSIDIEPAEQSSEVYVVSSAADKPEKPIPEQSEEEKFSEEQKPEAELLTEEQETESITELPAEEQESETIKELPSEEQKIEIEEQIPSIPESHFCTIEIRCDTVVNTEKLENQAVVPYVPLNGVILETCEMEFSPGGFGKIR